MPPKRIETGICLWDCEHGLDVSRSLPGRPGLKHFYLVRAATLALFTGSYPWAEGQILLKPVTRTVMAAYLSSVIRPATGARYLQSDRGDDLQDSTYASLRLQDYDRQRTSFLARTAHDFRAPLTALSGFIGLLTDGHLGLVNERQTEVLNHSRNIVKRLSRMTTALFEFSIAGERDIQENFDKNEICESIEQAIQEMASQAKEKRISLYIGALRPPTEDLHFERSQIEQVLVNLLDNACKATPKQGSVVVFGHPYFWERRFLAGGGRPGRDRRSNRVTFPNSYRVDICDTGPGIPADRMEDIFEEYTSYFGSRNRSGGGLGLAISRQIIHRHKGHIWARSQSGGATFSFVMPYRNQAEANPDRDLSAMEVARNSRESGIQC